MEHGMEYIGMLRLVTCLSVVRSERLSHIWALEFSQFNNALEVVRCF